MVEIVSITDRPDRKMPSRKQIADHWVGRCEHDDIRPPGPFFGDVEACWACGWPCTPDRAHIIDRCFDGLDGPQNLTLLCKGCHQRYPIICPGDEDVAWAWLWHQTSHIDLLLLQVQGMLVELGPDRMMEFYPNQ